MTIRYLLDTDWAIHYLNGHSQIVRRLHELSVGEIGLSVISLAELYEGVYCARDPQRGEQALNNFLRGVVVVGLDEEACQRFGRERGRLRAAGKTIGDLDILIGVTALQRNLILFTNNRRRFEMLEDLQIESTQSG